MMKAIPLGKDERRALQVSFQAFNALNHTEFSSINTTVRFNTSGVINQFDSLGNPSAGQYSATRSPRACLLTVRFQF